MNESSICAGCGEAITPLDTTIERDGRVYHRGTGCVLIDYEGDEPEIHPLARAIAKSKEPPPPSRQMRWRKKMMEAGRCPECGKQREEGNLCNACREKKKLAKRASDGWKPWVKGKLGRPPMSERRKRLSL